MDYIELKINDLNAETGDILISRLSEEGFESFIENENEILAYIPVKEFSSEKVEFLTREFNLAYTFSTIVDQNWNAIWEKQYSPVTIGNRCHIRAPFHDPHPDIPYEIVIEPKMSFGTAHHETTALMIEWMLDMEFDRAKVLDMGCGTGILAILAGKMGAGEIHAVDNDSWAYQNAIENTIRNDLPGIHVSLGDIGNINLTCVDFILANINRNILLEQIPSYSGMMKKGTLLVSGFYETDLPVINETAEKHGFRMVGFLMKNQWIAAKFEK